MSKITPACAGKRRYTSSPAAVPGDHPRVRGEEAMGRSEEYSGMGSPPRARGRAEPVFGALWVAGITPACAGKSKVKVKVAFTLQDHPRVRGEE